MNHCDYDGRSPLAVAAGEGHILVIEYLIFAGADPNSVDRWGRTPLADAVRARHYTSASLIRAAGGRLAGGAELAPEEAARLVSVQQMKRILALVKDKVFRSSERPLFSSEFRVNLVTDARLAFEATVGCVGAVQRLKEVAPAVVEFLTREFRADLGEARKAAINVSATTVGASAAILRRLVGQHAEPGGRRQQQHRAEIEGGAAEAADRDRDRAPALRPAAGGEKDGKRFRGHRRRKVKQEERQAALFHGVLLRFGNRDSPLGHAMWSLHEVIQQTVRAGASQAARRPPAPLM